MGDIQVSLCYRRNKKTPNLINSSLDVVITFFVDIAENPGVMQYSRALDAGRQPSPAQCLSRALNPRCHPSNQALGMEYHVPPIIPSCQ
jgi:hypothetical protein